MSNDFCCYLDAMLKSVRWSEVLRLKLKKAQWTWFWDLVLFVFIKLYFIIDWPYPLLAWSSRFDKDQLIIKLVNILKIVKEWYDKNKKISERIDDKK